MSKRSKSNLLLEQAFKLMESHFEPSEILKIYYRKMSNEDNPYVKVTLRNNNSYLLHYSTSSSETKWVKQ